MENANGKQTDSSTAVNGSEPESTKPKKKKNPCKGFSGPVTKAQERKKKFEGSAWFRQQKAWAEFIKTQMQDLKKVKPVVDDSAPRLNVSAIYDVEIMRAIWNELKSAFEVNQVVTKTLHQVNVLGGKTNTFSYDYSKPFSSNYSFRKDAAKAIEKQNQLILKMLKNSKTKMTTVQQYAEQWKRHEEVVESSSDFPLWYKVKKQEEAAAVELPPAAPHLKQHVTEKSAKYPDKRPRVFLEVSIRNVGVVGRMVVMLYSDYVPMTVKNFLAFCDPKAELTYKGNLFYLIFDGYYCQTGDVVENRGFGGTSIYGPYFGNEDFTLKHRERGMLTMYAKTPGRNASQFLITFRKLESLDGKNVVFGKVIKGLHVLDAIESVGSKKTGRPREDIYISDCDEI